MHLPYAILVKPVHWFVSYQKFGILRYDLRYSETLTRMREYLLTGFLMLWLRPKRSMVSLILCFMLVSFIPCPLHAKCMPGKRSTCFYTSSDRSSAISALRWIILLKSKKKRLDTICDQNLSWVWNSRVCFRLWSQREILLEMLSYGR